MNNDKEIKISVICFAFNHEKYIRQCIESIICQKTNFDYEIIINDDASTDDTAKIIKSYEEKYPDLIKPIYHKENQYSQNISYVDEPVRCAKGKYLAFCYGDDYWCDENKLQIQYDTMESNESIKICFCKIATYFENLDKLEDYYYVWKGLGIDFKGAGFYSSSELIALNNILDTTCLIRKKDYIPQNKVVLPDYHLALSAAIQGQGYCIDKTMAVYRSHESVTCFSERQTRSLNHYNNIYKIIIETCERMDKLSEYKFHNDFQKVIDNKKSIMLKFADTNILSDLKNKPKKYIYGTGIYGKLCYNELKAQGIDVDGFVVSDGIDTNNELKGLPVYHFSKLNEQENIFIIVSVKKKIQEIVLNQFETIGFKDFCIGITEVL